MSAAYLNVKKLSGAAGIRVAAKHNLREIQAELGADGHIDARKSNLNLVLAGPTTSVNVAAMAEQLMAEAGVRTLRRDAVRGIEVLVISKIWLHGGYMDFIKQKARSFEPG